MKLRGFLEVIELSGGFGRENIIFFFFFLATAWGILVPCPGINLHPSVVEASIEY